MSKHTQQILNAVQCRQPIEARAIQKMTKLDISDVHRNLRLLHEEGKVQRRPKNIRRNTPPYVWEVV